MDNKKTRVKTLRTVVSLTLVGLFVLGLIAMVSFSFQTGLILWVVSTLGGIGLLYWIRTTDKQEGPEGKETQTDPAPDGDEEAADEDAGA